MGSAPASPAEVAERLLSNRDRIVERWIERARAAVQAAAETRTELLVDSLPAVLGELADALANDALDVESALRERALGEAHGALRALLPPYDLYQVIREYDLLQGVLLDVLEEEGPISREARGVILETIQIGVRNAARLFTTGRDAAMGEAEAARAAASEETVAQKRRYEAMLAATNDHVFVVDEERRFTYVNRAAEEVLGRPREQVVGRTARELGLPTEFVERFEANVAKTLAGERVVQQTRFATPQGPRHFEYILSPFTRIEPGGAGVLGVTRDIEDHVTLVQSLEAEREQRERFVSALTHDLRTPLAAASLSADVLLRQPDQTAQQLRMATRIRNSLDRAARMIQDLLDATQLRFGGALKLRVDRCSLRDVVEDALDELSLVHGDRFVRAFAGELTGTWSRDGLRRLVENLATNAVKYGDPDAPIVVRAEGLGPRVRLTIHNDGPPIAEQDLPRIFEPFRRTRAAETSGQHGWGLGLTLVRGLAEAHGGRVSVESRAAEGTTFTVELPREAPGGPAPDRVPGATPSPP